MVEAFDTIPRKGEIGQTYNVDSQDRVSNMQLAEKLLDLLGLTDLAAWILHTRDRKFNDRRYAANCMRWVEATDRFRCCSAGDRRLVWKFAHWFGDIEVF